ncbi:MAG: ABC transporter permease [Pseudomonadota bacterium]
MAGTGINHSVFGGAGRGFLSSLGKVLDQVAFLGACLDAGLVFRRFGPRLLGNVLIQQVYFTGVQSMGLIAASALVFGGLIVLQGITQLSRLGSLDQLGVLLIISIMRELGPMLTAIIVILRSGSAIALEIGYMNVLGEIDGLEMQGISALHFLGVPRVLGVAVSLACLVVFFDIIAIAGGFLAVWLLMDITVVTFLHALLIEIKASDFLIVIAKSLCFGVVIPVVCLHGGFGAQKAVTNVPPRVSRALVDCLIYCLFFNIIISAAFMSSF